LVVDGHALGHVGGGATRFEQPVDLGVGVLVDVGRAARHEGAVQVAVGVGVAAVEADEHVEVRVGPVLHESAELGDVDGGLYADLRQLRLQYLRGVGDDLDGPEGEDIGGDTVGVAGVGQQAACGVEVGGVAGEGAGVHGPSLQS